MLLLSVLSAKVFKNSVDLVKRKINKGRGVGELTSTFIFAVTYSLRYGNSSHEREEEIVSIRIITVMTF